MLLKVQEMGSVVEAERQQVDLPSLLLETPKEKLTLSVCELLILFISSSFVKAPFLISLSAFSLQSLKYNAKIRKGSAIQPSILSL